MPYKAYRLDQNPEIEKKVKEFFESIEWVVRSFITDRMPDADCLKWYHNLPHILIGHSLLRKNFEVKKQINVEIDIDGQRLIVSAYAYLGSGPGRKGHGFVLEPIALTAEVEVVGAKLEEALQKISAVSEKDLVFMGEMADEIMRQRILIDAEPIYC